MLPVKWMVPSAAMALAAASIKHALNIVFSCVFSLMKEHSGLGPHHSGGEKSALDFPVSARVVSSGENDVEEENEKIKCHRREEQSLRNGIKQ